MSEQEIDAIDDFVDMVRTMQSLGISCRGLRTLDEMKQRVKETLRLSEKISSWTAKEAFSVLTDAKQEDERKRDILYKFYEDTEVCLNCLDHKIRLLLEQNVTNYKDKIAWHKNNLQQKEYIVLVAGETSSGKSTLLNLILGEQLLPYSVLSTSSTICELKYGPTPELVAHFKDKDPQTGLSTRFVQLSQSREFPQQSNLEEIASFVLWTDREKGSDYKKIELFWPHSLLKQGIVIVDSPGVGESGIMDDIVEEYLPEAFAFIYVINSANYAGGIQRDRLDLLIEHARKVSLDQQRETSSIPALFVCNKWDQVLPGEANEVKNHIVKKLTHCWPNLDPHSQIIYVSSTNASEAQALGIITKEFEGLMNSIKSMFLKSIEARLQTKWSWLDYLLSRMAYHTKTFLLNSHKDRQKVTERMMLITERLLKIEKQQSSVNKELQDYLENKIDYAVSTLSKYLKSSAVVEKFTTWTLDDVPKTEESWEVTRNFIQKAIMKRLQDVIASWEEENNVFSEARSSLIQYFQERFHFVEGQLKILEESVVAKQAASPSSDPLVGAMAVKGKYENWNKIREYEKDKSGFMAKASKEYLIEAAEEKNLRSYVVEQLKECQVCLRQVVARIPELIAADKILCQQLRDENCSQKEIEDFYKPLYERSLQLRDRMAMFGIMEVRTMEISSNDLEWQDDVSSLLGTGVFASFYRGKLKLPKKEQPVALKVWKDQLNDSNASAFLAEAETLRKLNHPHIVKFYGSSLLKEGDQVRAVLVMELCKENLMRHIFQNPMNIPATLPSSTLTDRTTIGWAKDIANGLEYIHKQGYVHRDLKLENISISLDDVAKIADVGVSKEEKMITGTMAGTPAYIPPEVIRSRVYDSKADMYSFGIMMWEMWYGRRAYLEVGGDLSTFWDRVAEGTRPSHVEFTRMPPDQWQNLMHSCWDGEAEKRPTATTCHDELTKLQGHCVSCYGHKQAFSVLTDAKQEDERKRDTLYMFYHDTEVCLNSMDDTIRRLLEQNIANYKEKFAWHKRSLEQKEYIVLVAGETTSGKSTLLNVILGEQLLPYSVLGTTSTIVCELKYGPTPKLVAHFKDKDPQTGQSTRTVQLHESRETSQQSNLKEISSFVHVKTGRENRSDYKKIELFWPHNLLKQGIVIVDCPGVSQSGIMDDMVKEYLPEAYAFIYVINSVNAGGIQRDKLEKLIEHARTVSLDHQREIFSSRALFVCNKWDQVPPGEASEAKNSIIKSLTHCWPNLDPHSQIIFMSSTNASEAQALGKITEEFAGLMNGIKSMVLKSIAASLQTKWRWLDYLLSRMAHHTKAFLQNSHKDRQKVTERMILITERLLTIEKQQSSFNKELQDYLENKTDYAVSTLSKYLKSPAVVETFTSWMLDDIPNTEESWEVTSHFIQKAITKRLQDVIASWEEESHVFSDARTSLIQYFQERFHLVEGQLRSLESSVVAREAASPSSDPLVPDDFSVAEIVIIGVTSPIWVPVGLVVLIVSVPVVGAVAVKEKYKKWSKTREYEKDKSKFMAKASKEYLTEAAEERNLRSYVVEQLKECQVCLRQVFARIPELIEADKMLCQQLRDETRSQKEIEDFYKPLYERSLELKDRMAMFGLMEVRAMEISSNDLEWKDDRSSLLGTGAFASVYRGKLKLPEKEQPVALKVWKDQLNESNASAFLAEAETLRKLNYRYIMKFYGSSLLKEGDQVRAVLVMELCKENLMRHIFQNPKNIPARMPSSTPLTDRTTIGWAKDIANGLEYIHKQGYVHRDLKLENILISLDDVVKIADVGVSKEEKMITGTRIGTPAFIPPEVIRSRPYDSKADMYSFGIMMWEMWYGRRAYLEVGGDLYTFWDRVTEGTRPSHVEGTRMPPDQWQNLMHSCWDGEAEKRPTATICHDELTRLHSTVSLSDVQLNVQ